MVVLIVITRDAIIKMTIMRVRKTCSWHTCRGLYFRTPVNESFSIFICTWFSKISISRNWFSISIFELDFLSISNLIFAGYTGNKNKVWNRQKFKLKNLFREIEILENQVQIDRGINIINTLNNFVWQKPSTD
jgi:hypothetical protein